MTKKLGLALGSGAARGWAHVGVLRALDEIGIKPEVITGCSVGALVGGAHLIGALNELETWARELKPLSALNAFTLKVGRGGLVDVASTFKAFEDYDQKIEDLPVKFGAVASDLGTGDEVWLTQGSVIEAARASSAIPVVFHAVQKDDRWLVDGALANPTPVTLARHLGANVVIAVDLNAVPRVLDRFDPPKTTMPATRDTQLSTEKPEGVSGAVAALIEDTRQRVDNQIALFKSRANASPHLFETAYAAMDIFQMHLTRANASTSPPDIHLKPDMRNAMPTAFDRANEFIEEGRLALLQRRGEIEALLS